MNQVENHLPTSIVEQKGSLQVDLHHVPGLPLFEVIVHINEFQDIHWARFGDSLFVLLRCNLGSRIS